MQCQFGTHRNEIQDERMRGGAVPQELCVLDQSTSDFLKKI